MRVKEPDGLAQTKLEVDARLTLLEQRFNEHDAASRRKLENIERLLSGLEENAKAGLKSTEQRLDKFETTMNVQHAIVDGELAPRLANVEVLLRKVLAKLE